MRNGSCEEMHCFKQAGMRTGWCIMLMKAFTAGATNTQDRELRQKRSITVTAQQLDRHKLRLMVMQNFKR